MLDAHSEPSTPVADRPLSRQAGAGSTVGASVPTGGAPAGAHLPARYPHVRMARVLGVTTLTICAARFFGLVIHLNGGRTARDLAYTCGSLDTRLVAVGAVTGLKHLRPAHGREPPIEEVEKLRAAG